MLIDGWVAACKVFNLRSWPIYLDLSDTGVPLIQVIGQHRDLEHKYVNECFSVHERKRVLQLSAKAVKLSCGIQIVSLSHSISFHSKR